MARAPGIPNKRTKEICDLIDKSKLGPAEFLIALVNNDFRKLGIDKPTLTRWTNAGIEYEEEVIKLDHRLGAAKELMKYRYSQKQSVALSSGDTGIKIVIEDYLGKK